MVICYSTFTGLSVHYWETWILEIGSLQSHCMCLTHWYSSHLSECLHPYVFSYCFANLHKSPFHSMLVYIAAFFHFYHATAMLRAVCAIGVSLSVCVSVCVSVTLRYCIKKAKRRITHTMPHDSPMTLVFCGKDHDKCRWGGLKFVTFDEKRVITRKR